MDNSNVEQSIINKISQALATDHPLLLTHKNRSLTVVVPIEDYQKFKAGQTQRLKKLRSDLNNMLNLVRGYTGRQSPEDLEATLTELRQELEQETKQPCDSTI